MICIHTYIYEYISSWFLIPFIVLKLNIMGLYPEHHESYSEIKSSSLTNVINISGFVPETEFLLYTHFYIFC